MITKEKYFSVQYVVATMFLIHLANVRGCSKGPTTQCPEYMCNDNKNCYTQDQLCDGNMDCEDNTDEDTGHCGNLNKYDIDVIKIRIYLLPVIKKY